ncbi:MAG: transcriptional regulator [Planctomycetaceae bacterium]
MKRRAHSEDGPGRFAYEGLERVIHEKARLGILTSLVTHAEGLLFADLKELCALTDGNLNRHLKVLQDEGLVEVWKGGTERRPKTLCHITPAGRDRFVHYLGVLEQVVADAARVADEHSVDAVPGRRLREGWSPA